VTAIVYEKYDMNLSEYAQQDLLEYDHIDGICAAVKEGMRHLHSLGIMHCDLHPGNILIRLKPVGEGAEKRVVESVVIADFDSALMVGEVVDLKHATTNWWLPGVKYGDKSKKSIDEYSFLQLRPWMVKKSCD
jgi:serine/threonine protein kinase